MTFKVGDKVTWTSKAGGITRTKVGEVIEVVPARMVPVSMPGLMGRPRGYVSYVVRAVAVGTMTESIRAYWPHVGLLQPGVSEEAHAAP